MPLSKSRKSLVQPGTTYCEEDLYDNDWEMEDQPYDEWDDVTNEDWPDNKEDREISDEVQFCTKCHVLFIFVYRGSKSCCQHCA